MRHDSDTDRVVIVDLHLACRNGVRFIMTEFGAIVTRDDIPAWCIISVWALQEGQHGSWWVCIFRSGKQDPLIVYHIHTALPRECSQMQTSVVANPEDYPAPIAWAPWPVNDATRMQTYIRRVGGNMRLNSLWA